MAVAFGSQFSRRNWSRWKLVSLEIGLAGNWSRWKLVSLETGLAGNWSRWKLVSLETGLAGNWSRWKLVSLETGLAGNWSRFGEILCARRQKREKTGGFTSLLCKPLIQRLKEGAKR
jgi:hypothetical protein